MSCNRVRRTLQEYIDGSASRAEREAVDAHVARCAGCARELEESRRLVDLLAAAPQRAVSEEFESNLMAALRGTAPVSRSTAWWQWFRLRFEWRLRVPAMVAAGSLAAAVIVAVVAPQVAASPPPPQPGPAADRGSYVSAVVERHQQLQRPASVNWDAVETSIDLNTGAVVTE